ncbi:SPW repeat protein [Kitasatospora sp. NPDC094015]|uniref:SPW repeat protein n=1 Tax=Kitasatospora sp. NPDC094015 TaxID=3155205 RepID=UPI00332FA2CD
MSTQLPMGMEHHPDILELREHYERAAATPRAQGVEALALVTGLFLAISPWVVGFSGFTALTISNLVLGLAFTVLMAGYGSAYERTHARAWACLAIGAWTCLAPWWTVGSEAVFRTILTNLVVGGLMICLSVGAISMAGSPMRRSSGGS